LTRVNLKESRPGVTTEESLCMLCARKRRSFPEPKDEILRGVYPEPEDEILRFAQDDRQSKGSG
jgi:hypothetical protein